MKIDHPITSDQIRLRSMTRDDLPLKVRWYNDPDIRKTLILEETLELNKTMKWFEGIENSQDRMDMMIETLTGKPIGITGLVQIDCNQGSAEIYIVIGEKDYWAKGIMLEAHTQLIRWAFTHLPIVRIFGVCRLNNIGSIVTLKKLGFQRDCLLKQYEGAEVYQYVLEKHNNIETIESDIDS